MKKLSKKGKVHPSPAPAPASNLSFLPATILTLAATLSPEDKQVLAYLISCCATTNNNNNNNNNNTSADNYKTTHQSFGVGELEPLFDCNCFRCYKSFWKRWDTSPNRQLIHEIIEAYEEGLFLQNNKRSLKKKKRGKRVCDEFKNGDQSGSTEVISSGGVAATASEDLDEEGHDDDDDDDDDDEDGVHLEVEKGSVTKIMNFLGEKIWNFWSMN